MKAIRRRRPGGKRPGADPRHRELERLRARCADLEQRLAQSELAATRPANEPDAPPAGLDVQDLKAQLGLLSQVIEGLPIGVLVVDRRGRLLLANQRLAPVLGLPLPQALGRGRGHRGPTGHRFYHLDGTEYRPDDRPLQRLLRSGEPLEDELLVRRPDGRTRRVVMRCFPLRDPAGLVVGGLALCEDVTAVRDHEVAMRQSEAHFRAMAEAMPQLLWRTDAQGRVDYVNSRWVEYTGLPPAQCFGSGWTQVIHPDDLDACLARWQFAFASGGPYEVRYRLRAADGSYRWYLGRGLPQRAPSGRIQCWLGTCTDIEDQVQGERVREEVLASEQRARQSAERTLRFSELFMGVLGHDLRSPLSAMLMTVETLQLSLADGPHARALGRIERAGERMNRMIAQLLDLTRIRLGEGLRLERQPYVDTAELARAAAEEVGAARPGPEVSIEVRGDGRGAFDPDRLAQVFSNLLDNAIVHGQPGPIELRLDGTAAEQVVVSVHNQGAIDAALLPTLFDPFHPIAGGLRRGSPGGLGLGLYIGAQIVEAHGGQITAESRPEHGTTFVIRLPRQ